jgi:hypothetical protein
MILMWSAALITCGSAAADRISSLDDLVKFIIRGSDRIPGASVDDVVTRSRVTLRPVAEDRGETFGNIMDTACFMNDIYKDDGWTAANAWLDNQSITEYQKTKILAQAQELNRTRKATDFGPALVEIICAADF